MMSMLFWTLTIIGVIWLLVSMVAIVRGVAAMRKRKRDQWKRPVLGRGRE